MKVNEPNETICPYCEEGYDLEKTHVCTAVLKLPAEEIVRRTNMARRVQPNSETQ